MKKGSFFSIYNSKEKSNTSATFSDTNKNIKCLRFLPWSTKENYKLVGSCTANLLIFDLTRAASPTMTLHRSIAVFPSGQITDFLFIEVGPSDCDLVCLNTDRQLGRLRQFAKMIA